MKTMKNIFYNSPSKLEGVPAGGGSLSATDFTDSLRFARPSNLEGQFGDSICCKASLLFVLCALLFLTGCSDADRLTVAPEEMTSEYVTVTAVVPGDIWATASRAEGETVSPISEVSLGTLVYYTDENGKLIPDENGYDDYRIPEENLRFSDDGKTMSFVIDDLPWRLVAPDEGKYWFVLKGTMSDGTAVMTRCFPDANSYGKPVVFEEELAPYTAKLTVNVKFDGVSIKPGGVAFPGVTDLEKYGDDVIMKAFYYPYDSSNSSEWEATDHYDYIGRDEWNSNHTIQLFTECVHDIPPTKNADGSYTHSFGGGAGEITPQPLTEDTKTLILRYFDLDANKEVSRYIDLSQVEVRRSDNAPTKGDLYDEEGNLFEGDVMAAEQSLFTPSGIYADGTEFGYNCGEHIVLNITVRPESADISVGSPTGIEIEAFTAADEDSYENDLGGTAKKSNE